MLNTWLLGCGAGLVGLWGAAHLFPTRKMIAGYGALNEAGYKIALGTWIAEGFTLMFVGVQIGILLVAFGSYSFTVEWAARINAGLLIILSGLSWATSARTPILPMKLCPVIKMFAAGLLIAGTCV